MHWEPEENVWALRILYNEKRFADRFGEQSTRV